jgi:predicted lysophospholipase L1 biosynthesis ABC-type transport system permease subunit
MALGAQRSEVLQAALGRSLKLLAIGSAAGLLLGVLAARVLAFIVYTSTPRDPLVLAGVVLAMLLLGLLAVDPSSARTVDRSDDAAARGLNRPYCKSGCRMSQARLPYLYPKRP